MAGEDVRISLPGRALFVATFVPLTVACIAGAPITIGLTLPFAVFFGWVSWFAASGGANPPARPDLFLLVCGLTIPAAIWATVLIEGAVT